MNSREITKTHKEEVCLLVNTTDTWDKTFHSQPQVLGASGAGKFGDKNVHVVEND